MDKHVRPFCRMLGQQSLAPCYESNKGKILLFDYFLPYQSETHSQVNFVFDVLGIL